MKNLLKYLKGYVPQSIIAPLFKLLEACFELSVPLITADIIDVGIKNKDSAYIYQRGGLLVLMGVLGLAAALIAQYFSAKASTGFGNALRKALYRHINTLSYKEIDRIGTSTLLTRLVNDTTQVQSAVNRFFRLFMRSPIIAVGAIVVCFTINSELTLIFLIAAPLLAFTIFFITKLTIPRFKKIQGKLDKVSLVTSENLSGVRAIRAFARQASEKEQFDSSVDSLFENQRSTGRISALLYPLTYVILNLAIAAIMWFGGFSVDSGTLSQGELIALINYMTQILSALVALALLIQFLTKGIASAGRINDIFAVKPSITDENNTTVEPCEGAAAIEFKNVSFAYSTNDKTLDNISFTAAKGDVIGIIGGTGSGKSTLISLIPRFYDADEGEILINGVNVKSYPLSQLSGIVGIVPQKAVLFKGTIRENLRWRKKNADDAEIKEALDIAQALEFVEQKPDKLDEMLTQGGKNLSGGQRQRLTIARALVGNPQIVILDDSASALDTATDYKLRKALGEKLPDTTTVIVSQRAASVMHADKIIVLDDGKQIATGTHRELFESCELYERICLTQMTREQALGGGV